MKKKVGERIRVARVTKGLSQQNMADELGLTVASYSNIERGVTDITITRLFEIARILQVKIENILDLVNSSQNVKDTGLPYLVKNEIDLVEIRKILADLQEEVKRLKG
jgi:transcriptional regulator with XRE-family HTH domain